MSEPHPMRTLPPPSVIALLAILAIAWMPASAQPSADAEQSPPAATQKETSGTAPQDMGSTGWTGPHRGDRTGTQDHASDQPLMATGVDLKGPLRRFPPSETPE